MRSQRASRHSLFARCREELAALADIKAGESVLEVDASAPTTDQDGGFDAVLGIADAMSRTALSAKLEEWRRALRVRGRIGLAIRGSADLSDLEGCRHLFREAGFEEIEVRAQVGSHSTDGRDMSLSLIYAVAWK